MSGRLTGKQRERLIQALALDDDEIEGHPIFEVVEQMLDAQHIETLEWAKSDIEERLDTYPMGGRHTRARWATAWLGVLIERAKQGRV